MDIRIFVGKKPAYDIASERLEKELSTSFNVNKSKMWVVYDIFGIDESQIEKAIAQVFSNPATDEIFQALPQADFILGVEYLPGQYDPRADSAMQSLQMLGITGVKVHSSLLYTFSGLDQTTREQLTSYLINPIEKRQKDFSILHLPQAAMATPVKKIESFLKFSTDDLHALTTELGLSMDIQDLTYIQEYFKKQNRNPTEAELKILDTYWSDHCRHTTFETAIQGVKWPEEKLASKKTFDRYIELRKTLGIEKPIRLMDIATIATKWLKKSGKVNNLDLSDEINACSIIIPVQIGDETEEWLLQFKNETHNHPTEIEPYGGASTCIGGAIRDPLAGRAYVYQAMRLSGAANLLEKTSDTLVGKLPQKKISTQAAKGYSDYGNQIGVPTTLVQEFFHPGYKAKRMEVGFVVGAVPKEWVRREKPEEGDVVILLGGRTGRDGIGGAVGSSKVHDGENIDDLSAQVQKGNPIIEGKIQRLFKKPEVLKCIKRCNDFGAGGISVAIGEIADSIEIELDNIRTKYSGLNGMELALSESQERMAVVVAPQEVDFFIKAAADENLEAYPVAVVKNHGKMKMQWQGQVIAEIDRDFLETNGAKHNINIEVDSTYHTGFLSSSAGELSQDIFLNMFTSLSNSSQKGLQEMFDCNIGRATLLNPYGGKYQDTPEDVSVHRLPTPTKTTTASMASFGFDPYISETNPYLGAYYAVVESITKLIAAGASLSEIRLSFQEYFEKLENDPKKWSSPFISLLGALQAQLQFSTPAIGGKDSMSGTYGDITVPPTLISFAIAPIEENNVISACLQNKKSDIYLFTPLLDNDFLIDTAIHQSFLSFYTTLHRQNKILSAKALHKNGVAYSLALMSFGNRTGVKIDSDKDLTTFYPGGMLLQLENFREEEIPQALKIYLKKVGSRQPSPEISIKTPKNEFSVEIDKLVPIWKKTMEPVFPSFSETLTEEEELPVPYVKKEVHLSPQKMPHPQVFIPVFPGTNSEFDSEKAFQDEGAKVVTSIFRNIDARSIEESIIDFRKKLDESQIFFIPGGFSAADEPDGSGKFIATILRNDKIKEGVEKLLERDGLILGICNGFQALVQSGLLPYGKITNQNSEDHPTLYYNNTGRHVAKMVQVRVCNDYSPWLHGMRDKIYSIPISHGEGRFMANQETLEHMLKSGQIATQYVDLNGKSSMLHPYNPNGSMLAIEGITSPCGKIYGRMGHPERYEDGLFKNIPQIQKMNIFYNAIKYFQ